MLMDPPSRATGTQTLTEYQALLSGGPGVLEAIPGAVYLCDSEGRLVSFNSEAAELWGRRPKLGTLEERFCGSKRLFLKDGSLLPHDGCPMAAALQDGLARRNQEVVIERPDGSRIWALVNIRPLTSPDGTVEGAINCFQDVSAQERYKAEIERKNRELEDFFENGAVALHIVNHEGIIVRANQAELDLLGYCAEEYIGRPITDFHADEPVIEDILARLSRGEQIDRYPARLRAGDGSLRHVLITSNGLFEAGQFRHTRCFSTDVTGLHAAEAARRESEERLAATYENANVGIAETDASGRFLRVNNALCAVLGRTREELLGLTFQQVTLGPDRERDQDLYNRQVRGELNRYSMTKRSSRPDGSVLFLDVFSSSVSDSTGQFRYGVRVVQDVTERQRLQEQLAEGERRLRELLESLPAAVYTTDAAGRITFFNKASGELAGHAPQLGQEWCVSWKLRWPDGAPLPHDECPMAIAIKENRAIRGEEAVAVRPDGSSVPFIAYPTPLRDAHGSLVGAVNMLIDITERKDAEIRQSALIDELNHRVKNTLATVQSLAVQTARTSSDMAQFITAFETRLLSLARAHDLLSRRFWRETPLKELILGVVTPLCPTDRVALTGTEVDLPPSLALSLAMVFNELATNALKYGALSSAKGSLAITWSIHHDGCARRLLLTWAEKGGPTVIAPTRRSFGTRLIERCVTRDLGGTLQLSFEPDGMQCHMNIEVTNADRR